jgi:raw score 8.11
LLTVSLVNCDKFYNIKVEKSKKSVIIAYHFYLGMMMNDALLFSGLITFSVIVGFVALKFFPKNPLIKAIYIVLGCISLVLGVIGIFLPILPTTPFLLLTLYSFAQGSSRLERWFLETKLYQKYLKSFNERRALTKKAKISILTFSTTMLLIGFYFTPSVVGRTIIAILIAVKYWFFFFWIKTEDVENG